jgi:hypothetical protein
MQKKAWSGQRPTIDHLRIFRCLVYAHIPIQNRKSFMTKEKNVFFLVIVIIQKLINYIILSPRNLLLVEMLFFTKLNFEHGAMMLSTTIRSDIMYSVNLMSRYMENPT